MAAAESSALHLAKDTNDQQRLAGIRPGSAISRFNWFALAIVATVIGIFTVILIANQRPAAVNIKADCSAGVTVHFNQTSYKPQSEMVYRATGTDGHYRLVLVSQSTNAVIPLSGDFTMKGCLSSNFATIAPEFGTYTVQYWTVDDAGAVTGKTDAADLTVA